MSDEHEPGPDPQHRPGSDEPTQPLAGWRPSEATAEPEREAGPEPTTGPEAGPEAGPEPVADPAPDPEPTSQAVPAPPAQPDGQPYGTPGPARQAQGAEREAELPGWVQPPPSSRPFGQPAATVPLEARPGPGGPGYFGPGPHPAYAPRPAPTRKLPLWVWPAVAVLALLVGVLGGLAGGALQDQLASERGTNDNGLGGVRTRTAAPLKAANGSVPAVAQALLPSTVQILAELDGQEAGATGSGFVLDRDGHVVTNNHVVASAAEGNGPIVVIDQSGQRHEATVMGRSAVYDLAVLTVEGAEALEPAALGASQALRVGDPVVAFGAPLGLSQTVTSGIVSALNRPVTTSGESDDDSSYINAVQTDAAINPGNSGGPLVNLAGEVVGVNSAIATTGGLTNESGNIGVGFAIPIEQVRTTVDQILRTGRAEYPVIGAQVRTGGEPDAEGATITEVMPDTPAERAGLEKDDVIVAVDDQPVNDGIALIVAIRTHLPGDTVEMSVVRGGEERIVQVELDGKVG
ncbi:S1C family serine protease [Nocardioides sp. SYSU D00065]|uniref:S1C family serine protease n=1 Tax=Nocardioides sp. SYSU D00065 TaxID=2817378 RepID=UPI001B32B0AB|nr:trypsin-like peptidase domain-containing protein [Nocardioides sp. SYSU D00065]